MREDDWFILRVQPSQEVLAADFLNYELAAETYFPVEKGKKVIHGKLTEYAKAAFAGYIYARFSSPPDWRRVSEHCRAKPRLIMRDGAGEATELHPLYEHDAAVERLRRLEALGRYAVGMANPFITKLLGVKIVVPCGPFKGQLAKVVKIDDNNVSIEFRAVGKVNNMTVRFEQAFPGRFTI